MADYLDRPIHYYNIHPILEKYSREYELRIMYDRITYKWTYLTTNERKWILDVYDQMIYNDYPSLDDMGQTILLYKLVDLVFNIVPQELTPRKEVNHTPIEEPVKQEQIKEQIKEPEVKEQVNEIKEREEIKEQDVFVFSDRGLLILDNISNIVASVDNTCKQKIKIATLKLDNILDEIDAIDNTVMDRQEKKKLIFKINEKLTRLEAEDRSNSLVCDNILDDERDHVMDEMLKIINSINATSSSADMYNALQGLLSLISKLNGFSEKDTVMEHIMKSYKTIESLIEIRKEKEELEKQLI